MSEKIKGESPVNFKKEWNEIRLCAELIRNGKAVIKAVPKKDGSIYRYTKKK